MKKGRSTRATLFAKLSLVLANGGGRNSGAGFRLELLPVVLNEILLLAMTVAGVEVVLQHLSVGLIKVPMVVIEAIDSAHNAGAMPAARAVHVKLAGRWIVNHLQKSSYLIRAGSGLINDWDVDVAQAGGLNGRLLIRPGIVGQIDYGFDPESRESRIVLIFGARAA